MIQFLTIMLNARQATSEKGATAVEYGLMVALSPSSIIAAVATLGGQPRHGLFTDASASNRRRQP